MSKRDELMRLHRERPFGGLWAAGQWLAGIERSAALSVAAARSTGTAEGGRTP